MGFLFIYCREFEQHQVCCIPHGDETESHSEENSMYVQLLQNITVIFRSCYVKVLLYLTSGYTWTCVHSFNSKQDKYTCTDSLYDKEV